MALVTLYPNVRNNIGWDIPIDAPQPKYWRGCVPGIPGGVNASGWRAVKMVLEDIKYRDFAVIFPVF